jgi:hypothetical protein
MIADITTLKLMDNELREELHEQWLSSPFTQELLVELNKRHQAQEETLDGLAQSRCNDLLKLQIELNRNLLLKKVIKYVRSRDYTE